MPETPLISGDAVPSEAAVAPSRERRDRVLAQLAGIACALLVAMATGSVLILAHGASPLEIYRLLLAGTWGNPYGFGQVLFKATPLIFTGLAVALTFRAGLFNVGGEGQLTLGSLTMAIVAISLPQGLPGALVVILAVAAGMLAGGLAGALPGYLRVRFGSHEVINTIMLNFIILAFVNFAVVRWWHEPETLHTAAVPEAARMARLSTFLPVLHGSAANLSFLVALAVAVAAHFVLFRSRYGFELGVMGLNPQAAETTGIRVRRKIVSSMAFSGALAALVGLNYVFGYKYYFEEGFSGGLGFMGIAVALLGQNTPLGVIAAALFFGTLSQGALVINAHVSKTIIDVLQAVTILAVVAASAYTRRSSGKK